MEAAAGIEPAFKGFADLCLTTLATPPLRKSASDDLVAIFNRVVDYS
jgi:hypothetical protein